MVCPQPLGWEQVAALIEEGTTESLGRLGRSEGAIKVYREFMTKVKEEYASVADFIKVTVFESSVHSTDGKRAAVDTEHADPDLVIWRLNNFPYNFALGMTHWLLWATRPLAPERVVALVAGKFPPGEWDALTFVNPPALQSVLAVWHCHVIVRPKPCAAPAAPPGGGAQQREGQQPGAAQRRQEQQQQQQQPTHAPELTPI